MKNEKIFDLVFGFILFAGFAVFTGFALSINFYEGLIPLICGIIGGMKIKKIADVIL